MFDYTFTVIRKIIKQDEVNLMEQIDLYKKDNDNQKLMNMQFRLQNSQRARMLIEELENKNIDHYQNLVDELIEIKNSDDEINPKLKDEINRFLKEDLMKVITKLTNTIKKC